LFFFTVDVLNLSDHITQDCTYCMLGLTQLAAICRKVVITSLTLSDTEAYAIWFSVV